MTVAQTTGRGRRNIKIAVWATLIALFVVCFAMVGGATADTLPSGSTTATSASAPLAAPGEPVVGTYNVTNAHELLPVFRWSNTQLSDTLSAGDVVPGAAAVLASFLFLAASVMWLLLSFAVRLGASMTLVDAAAGQINALAASIGSSVGAQVIAVIALIAAVPLIIRAAMKSQGAHLSRILIWLVIPFAAVQVLTASAAADTAAPSAASPVGLAQRASGIIDQVVGSVSSAVTLNQDAGTIWNTSATPIGEAPVSAATDPGCQSYTKGLYTAFDDALAVGTSSQAAATVGQGEQLKAISSLWELGFLDNWIGAQFGSYGAGTKAACHYLDRRNDVPAENSRAIALQYGGYGDLSIGEPGLGPWRIRDINIDREADTMAWVVCDIKDGKFQPLVGWDDEERFTPEVCQAWWENAGDNGDSRVDGNYRWANYGVLLDEVTVSSEDPAVRAGEGQLLGSFTAMYGLNSGERLLRGFITLITALVYLYGFGALAIGSFVAQAGLVIMIALLPVTLILLAFGRGESRSGLGVKMLRLTAGFLVARVLLLLVLTVTVNLVLLINSALMGTGIASRYGLAGALVPLAVIFIMRKIMQRAGLGDLLKLTGAATMPMAVARAADKGSKESYSKALQRGSQDSQAALQGGLRKAGLGSYLDKYDSYGFGTGKHAKRAAVGAGKWTGGAISGKAQQAWSSVRGRKNQESHFETFEGRAEMASLMAGAVDGAGVASRGTLGSVRDSALTGGVGAWSLPLAAVVGSEIAGRDGYLAAREAQKTRNAAIDAAPRGERKQVRLDTYDSLLEGIQASYAEQIGLEPGQILSTQQQQEWQEGIAERYGIDPASVSVGSTALPPVLNLTPDQISNMSDDHLYGLVADGHSYLITCSQQELARRPGELNDAYVARIQGLNAARGGITPDGIMVNMADAHGLSVVDVADHLRGEPSRVAEIVRESSSGVDRHSVMAAATAAGLERQKQWQELVNASQAELDRLLAESGQRQEQARADLDTLAQHLAAHQATWEQAVQSGDKEEAEALEAVLSGMRRDAERVIERYEAAASDRVYAALGDVTLTREQRMTALVEAQTQETEAKKQAQGLRAKFGVISSQR